MANNKETVYLGAHIPKEIHEALVKLSETKETSVSGLIRLALKEFIQKKPV